MKLHSVGFCFFKLLPGLFLVFFGFGEVRAQDTLKIMAYNVLHYGDLCQGSNNFLHSKLKTIVKYESPDVLGLVKAQVIKRSASDFAGVSPVGFADSILLNGLNAAYVNRYDYCPLVNFSNSPDGDMDLLFYNKNKFGFVSIKNLCADQEDFNLYKLYYKDPNLPVTKDSTFVYFILNHTVSGTDESARDSQQSQIVSNLKRQFSHLPNLISMGDFNTHSSYETGYQLLTNTTDTSFVFNDPPFYPDSKLKYPANWDADPESFSGYLNTSTRAGTLPNACGSDGGAKNWYLHIFLSPWIVKNKNYAAYVAQSYKTIGNDGNRVGFSINDTTNTVKNTSAPTDEVNALFQFSDKYPVLVKIVLSPNVKGTSLPDPDLSVVTGFKDNNKIVTTSNPVGNTMTVNFTSTMVGEQARLSWIDIGGRLISTENFVVTDMTTVREENFIPGVYILCIQIKGERYYSRVVKKWD